MSEALSLIMDAMVIVLLAGTIFYAMRLSRHIQAFRNARQDMEKLLADLSSHIDKAEDAIEGLRSNARQAGRDLQVQINDARALSEELQIMSESGNSLAGRLEKLAEGARGASTVRRTAADIEAPRRSTPPRPPARSPAQQVKSRPASVTPDPLSAFAIRDPEFDDDLDATMNEDGLMQGDLEEDGFGSQAERDLYEALRGRNKTEAGGV